MTGKPTPDMPLLTFGRECYMAQAHHNSGKLPTRQLRYKIVQLVDHVDELLGRQAIVSDLTAENADKLAAHFAAIPGKPSSVTQFLIGLFRCLLRYAGELELVEVPDALLPQNPRMAFTSDAEGTLWNIAETLYFPRNVDCGEKTRRQYGFAFNDWGRTLGRPPMLKDLTDDALLAWMRNMLDRQPPLSLWTINERVGRVKSLWTFLGKRGVVKTFPTVRRLAVPEVEPVALSEEEMWALFKSAEDEPGRIDALKAAHWWQAYFAVVWSTGERKGAAMALRWDGINLRTNRITIPAAVRKGRCKTGIYPLWPEVATMLARIREPKRDLVFPWDRSEGTYWRRYGRILRRAGLPDDRKHKTKALRVSHATFTKILGGDPTRALMHGDPATTIKHYLDRTMLPMEERRLFVPWQEDRDGTAGAIDGLLARGKQPIVPLIVEPEPEIETELAWL